MQNELRERYSQTHSMKKQQELQDIELRMELKIKEAALEFLRESDLQLIWEMKEIQLKGEQNFENFMSSLIV